MSDTQVVVTRTRGRKPVAVGTVNAKTGQIRTESGWKYIKAADRAKHGLAPATKPAAKTEVVAEVEAEAPQA